MKVRFLDFLVLAALWAIPATAYPYDVAVHGKISEQAFSKARATHNFLADLGIDPATSLNGKSPDEWVVSGSATEDDGFRSRNHFFDPVNNVGLLGTFSPARDWAINGIDTLGITNNYSIPQARQYFYTALTASSLADRDQAWANTFRSVGQFTHLLQDMAQPQHVRNDIHISFSEELNWLTPGYSRYELYTNDRESEGVLRYDGSYPIVLQPTYREYWQAGGKGLAEFTNANFVSEDSNLDFNPYPGPAVTNAYTYEEVKPLVTDMNGVNYTNVTVRYVGNTFTDAYTGGAVTNNYLSAFSVFDFVYRSYSPSGIYTMTDMNYQHYADLLIPRAVGYSAGLINYFFRGKIDFGFDPADPSKYLVKNLGTEPMDGTFSVYYDAVDGMRYPVKRADGTVLEWSTGGPLSAGGALSVPVFSPPRSPAPQTPGTYMLVFKGDMGIETRSNGAIGAVAAKESKCASNTQQSDYPAVAFSGDSSYESMPVTWLSRDADGKLFLDGFIWIKKNPIPPPVYKCFWGPYGCIWYLAYPPSPYLNANDPTGERYDPALQSGDEFVKVWIDLNGDKVFSNDELVLEKRYSPYLVAATWYTNQLITLHEPLNVTPGNACQTGMRTAMRWNQPPTGPNDNFAYGSLTTEQVQLR